MKTSVIATLPLLSILTLSALSIEPDSIIDVGRIDIPEFPEIPSAVVSGDPLFIQLAAPVSSVKFRTPIDFYIRFVNLGKSPIYVPVSDNCASGVDLKLKWKAVNENDKPKGYVLGGGFPGAHLILLPRQPVIIRVLNKLLPPGKHTVTVTYINDSTDKGAWRGKIESNPISVIIDDSPPDADQVRELERQFEELSTYMASSEFDEMLWLRGMVTRRLMLGSPFSVPFLKKQLSGSLSPSMREHAAQIIAAIADRDRAKSYGFPRDTSAKELILTQMLKETNVRVLESLLGAILFFSDVMNEQEKISLRSNLIKFLDHENSDIHYYSALQLARIYPNDNEVNEIIQQHLNRPDFLSESSRSSLVGNLKDIYGSRIK